MLKKLVISIENFLKIFILVIFRGHTFFLFNAWNTIVSYFESNNQRTGLKTQILLFKFNFEKLIHLTFELQIWAVFQFEWMRMHYKWIFATPQKKNKCYI